MPVMTSERGAVPFAPLPASAPSFSSTPFSPAPAAPATSKPIARRWRDRWLPRLGLTLTVLAMLRIGNGPVGGLIVGFAVMTPLELLFRRHHQKVRRPGLRTDMFHLLFTGALSAVATVTAVVLWFIVLLPVTRNQRNPLFVAQPQWLQTIETILALELMGYLAHRALHEVPLFWRFHAIHHSSSTLDWISGARAHPVEGFFAGLVAAPPLLLLGIDVSTVGIYTAIVGLWGVFLHANIRWRFSWMDGWWGTPDYHHWHHSNHPEARNKNYSAFLPVFDRLFGTYYQPKDRRPFIYGIDEPVPQSWLGQLREPLRRRASRLPAFSTTDLRRSAGARVATATLEPPPADTFPRNMTTPSTPPADGPGPPFTPAQPSAPAGAWGAPAATSAHRGTDATAGTWDARIDDRALVAGVAAGDRVALETLYRIHAGWLVARLQGRCRDQDLVDIALQDTYLAVWTSAGSFRGDGDVGAWLWGIAIRKLIDQLRKRRPAPVDPATIGRYPTDHGGATTIAASAEAELFASGIDGELASALVRLDPDLRAVMLATAVDGLSTKEAATLLGIPQGTVKTRLQRARSQLRELLA